MTRPVGFGKVADVAVDLFDDDRVLDAVEAAGDRAVLAYLAVVLASWARGERLALAQVARRSPAAYRLLDALPDLFPALRDVGLLDADGRIPTATWDSWYGPAATRYATRVDAGRRGGLTASGRRTTSTTTSTTDTRPSVRPTVREESDGRTLSAGAGANGAAADAVYNPASDRWELT